jgi:hypothetical protein
LLLFFAHEGLRETVEGLGAPALRKRAPYFNHALCWLAYPEDYKDAPPEAVPNFAPWTKGVGACILEALQHDLAARWIHVESSKERIEQPPVMRALGVSQERVLEAFLTAVEKANRRDLARFLLRAAEHLLGPHAHPGMWTGGLQMTGQRLADRAATYQAGLVLLRQMERLANWTRWARACGYLDEDYQAAQLWLSDWGAARLMLTDRALTSLRVAGVPAELMQKLAGLKDRPFETQARFLDAVATVIAEPTKNRAQDELKPFQDLLLSQTAASGGFEFTDKALESLRAKGVPEKVARPLVSLKEKSFEKRDEFLDEAVNALAQDERKRVQDLVLDHATQATGGESTGDVLVHRAQTIIRNLDPMRQAVAQ